MFWKIEIKSLYLSALRLYEWPRLGDLQFVRCNGLAQSRCDGLFAKGQHARQQGPFEMCRDVTRIWGQEFSAAGSRYITSESSQQTWAAVVKGGGQSHQSTNSVAYRNSQQALLSSWPSENKELNTELTRETSGM